MFPCAILPCCLTIQRHWVGKSTLNLYKYFIANSILNSRWKEGKWSNCLFFHSALSTFLRQPSFCLFAYPHLSLCVLPYFSPPPVSLLLHLSLSYLFVSLCLFDCFLVFIPSFVVWFLVEAVILFTENAYSVVLLDLIACFEANNHISSAMCGNVADVRSATLLLASLTVEVTGGKW